MSSIPSVPLNESAQTGAINRLNRAFAKSGKSIKNKSESLSGDGREATAGIGNIGKTTHMQQTQDEIVKDGNGVGSGANGQLASIFMKGDIAGVVEFVFNGPMVTV